MGGLPFICRAEPIRCQRRDSEGHHHVEAVTPRSGPIEGKGGIVFTEVTCLPSRTRPHALGEAFLQFLLEPESAYRAAITPPNLQSGFANGSVGCFQPFQQATTGCNSMGRACRGGQLLRTL